MTTPPTTDLLSWLPSEAAIAEAQRVLSSLFLTPSGDLTITEKERLLENLPRLSADALPENGDECPICYTSWHALLAEEEVAVAMDSPAHPLENLGFTRLSESGQCGHHFCRRDITKWIEGSHNSCPVCRHPLISRNPSSAASNSDEESNNIPQHMDGISTLINVAAEAVFNSNLERAVTQFFDDDGRSVATSGDGAAAEGDGTTDPVVAQTSGIDSRALLQQWGEESMGEMLPWLEAILSRRPSDTPRVQDQGNEETAPTTRPPNSTNDDHTGNNDDRADEFVGMYS